MPSPKKILLKTAASLGIPRWYNKRFHSNRLAILMYHGVTPEPLPVPDWCFIPAHEFREQMQYLERYCHVLPLDVALTRMHGNALKTNIPTVAITFDDGYQNNHDVALPILREFKLPATIFLNTAFIGTENWLWFARIHAAVSVTQKQNITWRGENFSLKSIQSRAATSSRLQTLLKELPHAALLTETDQLIQALGGEAQATPQFKSAFQFLDHASIANCFASDLITFGAHTHNHTILSHLSESEQREEIKTSIDQVTTLTSRRSLTFAYPNGRPQDFNATTIQILKQSGIYFALTTRDLANSASTDRFHLARYGIGNATPMHLFQAQIHHLLSRGRAAA